MLTGLSLKSCSFAKMERQMAEVEGQAFETMLMWDMFHQNSDEYREWGNEFEF